MIKGIVQYAFLAVGLGILLANPAWAAEKAKPVSLTVRVVDAVCLLPSGLKGESHRECAIGCDQAGIRMYLLDEKANVMYAAMADAPFKDPNSLLREHLERVVMVKGNLYTGPGGLKVVEVKEVQPMY
ncbi:MAG: hypothetical protein KGL31_07460 [candidate division NC10 bacterium]|nr:hypothetical protein [candidate division NC10 bacterium]MDE2321739.1 hypothetical protein [candidate division NC10 bacterium]